MNEIIGIDIDGVILDFEKYMRCYAELYDFLWLDKSGKIDNNFSYLKNYDWSSDEKDYFIKYFLEHVTYKTPLIACAKEVLEILKSMGYKIVIITARGGLNPKTKDAVLKVLKLYNIPYDEIYFKQHDKVNIAESLKIKYMIDDNPKTIIDLVNNGISTLYFRDINSPKIEHNLVTEVSNWGEILRILNNPNLDKDVAKKILIHGLEN